MVFKVGKGGVRSGNTLRGLNTTRTKRYGRHACLLGYTSLGKRDLTRLIRDGSDDNPLVSETLVKTDVLLSLNKQKRWRLPAMVGQMIKDGDFNKGAVVSLLEKHKLKRKANCVRLLSSNARTSCIAPKNNKYFSYSLDSVADDRSKRQRKREVAEERKKMGTPRIPTKIKSKGDDNTIHTFTADGIPDMPKVTEQGSVFDNDRPEYRLEVFYPCPRSCSLTYNPKYTDVSVVEGKEGELEVKSNVKAHKKGATTHRKRFTQKDVERLYCDEIDEDVDEMWSECQEEDEDCDDNFDKENEVHDITNEKPNEHGRECTLEMLIFRAERAKELCALGRESVSNSINKTKKRSRTVSTSCTEDEKKSHVVFVGRDEDEKSITIRESKLVPDSPRHRKNLDYFRIILATSETAPETLRQTYGTLYAEATCQSRRFVIDVTDDISNLLASSKASTKEINYSSYLVCVYDGFYDNGMAAYKVSFNSMIAGDMAALSETIPFRQTSIPEIMNALVCHLLDLKEKNSLEYVERNVTEGVMKNDAEFLNSRMKLKVDVFDPSDEISKLTIMNSIVADDIDEHIFGLSTDFNNDDDLFCDVCYTSVTSSRIDSVSGTRLKACGHLLCDECWASHFRTGINDGKTVMACGGYDCDTKVGVVTLLSILGAPEVALLLKRLAEEEIESSEKAKWCPIPECGRVIRIDSKSQDLCVDVTCACGNKLCFSCMGPAHWPATCEQAEEYLDKLPSLTPAKEYVEEESRPSSNQTNNKKKAPVVVKIEGRLCPRCNKFIEKNGGCTYMICRCGFGMCWNCMKSSHNGSCTPDYSWVHKHTRTVMVHHAVARQPLSPAEDKRPLKIYKNKKKASLYQRALQQREEVAGNSKYERSSHNSPIVAKMYKLSQRDPEFKQEIIKFFSQNKQDVSIDAAFCSHLNVQSRLKEFISTTVEMKKELHRVREYTFILLQGTPNSVAKQRIMKLANDLNGFCSFVASILDLQDNQDATTAFRRLVDLRGWAERALDALIRTTRSLRVD